MALTFLAFSWGARAQVGPPAHAGALGQRYVEARGGRTEPEDRLFFDHKNVGEVAFNLPIAAGVDATLGAALGKAKGSSVPGLLLGAIDFTRRERSASLRATAYVRRGGIAPFVRVAGAYGKSTETRSWGPRGKIPGGRVEVRDQSMEWSGAAGAEIVVGRVALTPEVKYFDSDRDVFGGEVRRAWIYGGTVHAWLTRSVAGFVQADHTRAGGDSAYRACSWTAGVRVRF